MTSLFCNSWMCRQCGREACPDCYDIVKKLTKPFPPDLTSEERATLQKARERHANSTPFFLSCTRRVEHSFEMFSPVSRFAGPELDEAVKEMSQLVESKEEDEELTVNPDTLGTILANPSQPGYDIPLQTPSHPIKCFSDEELTEEKFRAVWRRGEPIIVKGLLHKFHIKWTPEYFVEKHGAQTCLLLDCQKDGNEKQTVGKFFSGFGQYECRTICHKLKVNAS